MQVAIDAAHTAGAIIRAGWGQTHEVEMKGVTNPVTEVDRAAEKEIITILRAATPGFDILAEESGASAAASTKRARRRWVIDPLDGTVNYAHHFPYFAVSIGLERDGESELGVVYDPIHDQLFTAERGRGAYLNGAPIHCSAVSALGASLIATGFPYDVWETGGNIPELGKVVQRAQMIRVNGCAALDIANVACGRLEAYYDLGLYAWDIAAGRVLVTEAGGVVSAHGGDPEHIETQFFIFSNAAIHSSLAELLLADRAG